MRDNSIKKIMSKEYFPETTVVVVVVVVVVVAVAVAVAPVSGKQQQWLRWHTQ